MIQLSVGCICVLILTYLIYRFVKSINRRFHKLEEVLARLIEKNNQMHHFIQQSSQSRPVVSQPTSVGTPPRQQPHPVSVAPPSPVIDLDAELKDELEELKVKKTTIETPREVVEKETVEVESQEVNEKEPTDLPDDVPEGRIDT